MSHTEHHYDDLTITWTGNRGTGTSSYRAHARDHEVVSATAGALDGSADPAFRGDPHRWNPEQLLVVSLAQCHMLWYLHLAMEAGVTVTAYQDHPTGTMTTDARGAGQFDEVVLRPRVTISAASDPEIADRVHGRVPEMCFIARSVNFPVRHRPQIVVERSG